MLHLVSLSVLSAANAQLVEFQTLDQWILYKTFHSVHVMFILIFYPLELHKVQHDCHTKNNTKAINP